MVAVIIAAALAVFGQTAAVSSARTPQQDETNALVQQLRDFDIGPGSVPSNGVISQRDVQRDRLYAQLRQLGDDAWPALSRGLSDPDVRVRRGVLIYLQLGVAFVSGLPPHTDFLPCLPALIVALKDDDQYVRSWAAQSLGVLGPKAAAALPALIARLMDSDDLLRRDVAGALGQVGPAAKAALPLLRNMLVDPNAQIQRVVQIAIDKIQEPQ